MVRCSQIKKIIALSKFTSFVVIIESQVVVVECNLRPEADFVSRCIVDRTNLWSIAKMRVRGLSLLQLFPSVFCLTQPVGVAA